MPTEHRGSSNTEPLAQKAGGFSWNLRKKRMTIIKIDGYDYDSEQLSAEAQAQLGNVQLTDQEIQRLQIRLAIAQTARNAYAKALQAALTAQGDTLKFN